MHDLFLFPKEFLVWNYKVIMPEPNLLFPKKM